VLVNTTWATQATTLQDEILASSTGEPDQVFRTTQAPVLAGQRLDVREPKVPPEGEQAALKAVEGDDAIAIRRDEAGRAEDIWVRWHAVADFYGSAPRDRHYVIDALSGAIRFGDGRHGLVPPAGRSNIRMALYRTGGGARGNRAAETIAQLKTTVPYVEGVLNSEAARGGADWRTSRSGARRPSGTRTAR
jgi:predicted phage baseplate assembly protein